MQIKKFWVVTRPTKDSEMCDIVFESDWNSIGLQFKGGLDGEDIHSVYNDKEQARLMGEILLSGIDISLEWVLNIQWEADEYVWENKKSEEDIWKMFSRWAVNFMWDEDYGLWNAHLYEADIDEHGGIVTKTNEFIRLF